MTAMSLDFSEKIDLIPLASVVQSLQVVAQPLGVDYFLMGAAARDLMLRHAHNIAPSRLTEDVDFAVSVPDRPSFESLRVACRTRIAACMRHRVMSVRCSLKESGSPIKCIRLHSRLGYGTWRTGQGPTMDKAGNPFISEINCPRSQVSQLKGAIACTHNMGVSAAETGTEVGCPS